ncbi:hypothetical protein CLG_0010 (plasmid) [Clostridium botulinum D str. 1873]|uniref:Uncharacterized protein n=1 Tax=Clostridium botulinum D str. 1873 TaxID=592027 RepID=A0A9N7AL38_CLOBO|nr:hypothetical protein CLG_0010 [Clostridium botulinum D str. 1873]AYF55332.1 hypothetical protein DFH04_11425 [Clostridium novyi]
MYIQNLKIYIFFNIFICKNFNIYIGKYIKILILTIKSYLILDNFIYNEYFIFITYLNALIKIIQNILRKKGYNILTYIYRVIL